MPLRGGMEIDSVMQNPSDGPSRRKKEKEKGRKRQMRRWALTVLLASFLITALLSLASGEIIEGLPMFASILVLVLFVALGIVFDIIGLAVATADVTAFNSMAARRLKTGKKAVWLISNTEKVSSVCNDVIGDIAGVGPGRNWAHVNSVDYDPTDDSIIISSRHQSAVVKIGRDKKIKWILASPEGWKKGWAEKVLTPVDAKGNKRKLRQ